MQKSILVMLRINSSQFFVVNLCKRKSKKKTYPSFVANMCAISYGNLIGWLSPSLLILFSPNTPMITGPISTTQASWLGSISYLGGFFGTFLFLIIIKFLGRKMAFCILAIPYFVIRKFTETLASDFMIFFSIFQRYSG